MKATFYLVNNKVYEPDLPGNIASVVEANGKDFKELDIANLSFFCPAEKAQQFEIYNGIQKLSPAENDYFFIRKWHPNSPATILLTVILREMRIPFSEEEMSTQHTALQSKLTQPFQLKGIAAFPDTWVTTKESFEINKDTILKKLSFPLILKLKGAESRRVWKCDSKAELDRQMHEVVVTYPAKLIMLQEFVPNDFDIRILVWRGSVLAALQRTSTHEFLNNIEKGYGISPIKITATEKEMALKATQKLGFELAGIDIVRTEHGPLLFEVNKTPDIAQYNEAAGCNIEEQIVKDILSSE